MWPCQDQRGRGVWGRGVALLDKGGRGEFFIEGEGAWPKKNFFFFGGGGKGRVGGLVQNMKCFFNFFYRGIYMMNMKLN